VGRVGAKHHARAQATEDARIASRVARHVSYDAARMNAPVPAAAAGPAAGPPGHLQTAAAARPGPSRAVPFEQVVQQYNRAHADDARAARRAHVHADVAMSRAHARVADPHENTRRALH